MSTEKRYISKYFPINKLNKKVKTNKPKLKNEIIQLPVNQMVRSRLIDSNFWKQSTIDLAKALLGKYLCRSVNGTILKAIIVETEAYLGAEDHASYSFGGRRTEANEPMYLPAGTCFTRMTYGVYYCFNISSNDEGGAVLLRAAEPIEGLEKMSQLRRLHPKAPRKDKFEEKPYQLANGPSKLYIAFDIDSKLNKASLLVDPNIWIEDSNILHKNNEMISRTRVGISASNLWSDKLLRFYLNNYQSVSKK
ncbi:hypothetical protein BLOT_012288 [Blomia tropicalis]|nr:hypothetical protein BLOT_012288 [Blomia tropicalis]